MAMDNEAGKRTTVSGILYDVSVAAVLVVGTFGIEWLKHTLFPNGAPWALKLMLNFSELTLILAFVIPFLGITIAVIGQSKVLLRELGAGEAWQRLGFAAMRRRLYQRLFEAIAWGLIFAASIVAPLCLVAWLGLLNWPVMLGVAAVLALIAGILLLVLLKQPDSLPPPPPLSSLDARLKKNWKPVFVLSLFVLSFLSLLNLTMGPIAAHLLDNLLIRGPLAIDHW
jgi:hypothetical protein